MRILLLRTMHTHYIYVGYIYIGGAVEMFFHITNKDVCEKYMKGVTRVPLQSKHEHIQNIYFTLSRRDVRALKNVWMLFYM